MKCFQKQLRCVNMIWISMLLIFVSTILVETNGQCTGRMSYVRYDEDSNGPTIVVKLNTKDTEHYTKSMELRDVIMDMMFRAVAVNLITDSCDSGDHGFAAIGIVEDNSVING